MPILSEYRKQKLERERDKFWSAVIVAACIAGSIIITVVATVYQMREARFRAKLDKIYENMLSCPQGTIIYYRGGEPYVMFKGRKIYIERETCEAKEDEK